jgi:hypothetical protein
MFYCPLHAHIISGRKSSIISLWQIGHMRNSRTGDWLNNIFNQLTRQTKFWMRILDNHQLHTIHRIGRLFERFDHVCQISIRVVG